MVAEVQRARPERAGGGRRCGIVVVPPRPFVPSAAGEAVAADLPALPAREERLVHTS